MLQKELQDKQSKHKNVTNQIGTKMKRFYSCAFQSKPRIIDLFSRTICYFIFFSIELKKNEMPDIKKEEERIGKDIKKLNEDRVKKAVELQAYLMVCLANE